MYNVNRLRKENDTMSYESQKRWRLNNTEKRNAVRKRNYRSSAIGNINFKKNWDQEDDIKIIYSDLTDRQLHLEIGRSVQAIQMRRFKIMHGIAHRHGVI